MPARPLLSCQTTYVRTSLTSSKTTRRARASGCAVRGDVGICSGTDLSACCVIGCDVGVGCGTVVVGSKGVDREDRTAPVPRCKMPSPAPSSSPSAHAFTSACRAIGCDLGVGRGIAVVGSKGVDRAGRTIPVPRGKMPTPAPSSSSSASSMTCAAMVGGGGGGGT